MSHHQRIQFLRSNSISLSTWLLSNQALTPHLKINRFCCENSINFRSFPLHAQRILSGFQIWCSTVHTTQEYIKTFNLNGSRSRLDLVTIAHVYMSQHSRYTFSLSNAATCDCALSTMRDVAPPEMYICIFFRSLKIHDIFKFIQLRK